MTNMLNELFGIDIKEMAEYSYLVHSSKNEFIPDISNRTGFDSGLLPIVTPLANFENNRVDNINEWLEDIRHDGQQTKIIDNSAVKYTGKLCYSLRVELILGFSAPTFGGGTSKTVRCCCSSSK